VEPSGRLARVAYALALAGALVGATLIFLIAGALSGIWRTLALAVLAPMLVLSILALWRAAHGVSALGKRRVAVLETLQQRGIIGILARPELGAWEERLQRTLLLPAGTTLWSVGPENVASPQGQERLHDLYLLLGQVRPRNATLALPARATLVLADATEPLVRMWDLSAYFERADAGDEAALDALADLEADVQGLIEPAVRRALAAGNRGT
jgi:hypothetical protein